MEDMITKRRVFYFGADANYHIHVSRGARGRWRWSVTMAEGATVCLSPVRGWESELEARDAASSFFGALGVELQEVTA